MTTAVLLDHVRSYAAAVRFHLADLSPEQVEDLTDGLEADLAEALEDPHGVAVTGAVPTAVPPVGASPVTVGERPADPSGQVGASLIDLTTRFGPAADYAAELRSAAGIAPAGATRRRRSLRARWGAWRDGADARLAAMLEPLTGSKHWPAVVSFGEAVRPAWWVLRGWLWFVILSWLTMGLFYPSNVLAPDHLGRWLVLSACVVLSVQWARGLLPERRWSVRVLRTAHVVALIIAVPVVLTAASQSVTTHTVYIDNTVYGAAPPEDGVYVEGQMVSNLFVYDADGNPLSGVQIFDDRGRQVRTTYDEGSGEWYLPGVDEPWSFAPSVDGYGRVRWNVYPLSGAPLDAWTYDDEGRRVPADGYELRVPPHPFAKAPAVVVPGAAAADGEEPEGDGSLTDRTTGAADAGDGAPTDDAERPVTDGAGAAGGAPVEDAPDAVGPAGSAQTGSAPADPGASDAVGATSASGGGA